jgi:flagellar L-ring protein precursor FlgH
MSPTTSEKTLRESRCLHPGDSRLQRNGSCRARLVWAQGSEACARPTLGLLLAGVLALTGCVVGSTRPDPAYAATRPVAPAAPAKPDGAIYRDGHDLRLFEDTRARQVGDILTVLLVESTDASKSASTKAARDNSFEVANPTLLGKAVNLGLPGADNLEMNISSASDFSGAGSSSQSNRLEGSISVTVAEVMPNGNLVIRGEKLLALNQGDESVRISGIVRPVDITPQNTVLSTKVADAHISYGGKGTVNDSNVMPWLAKLLLMFFLL